MVIGDIALAKIDKLEKETKSSYREHSAFAATIYVPSVNKEST